LQSHPRIYPGGVDGSSKTTVRIIGLLDPNIQAEVSCWFQTTVTAEFQDLRHEVLLKILEIIREHGVMPTRRGERNER
jgi:hypothetical protein